MDAGSLRTLSDRLLLDAPPQSHNLPQHIARVMPYRSNNATRENWYRYTLRGNSSSDIDLLNLLSCFLPRLEVFLRPVNVALRVCNLEQG